MSPQQLREKAWAEISSAQGLFDIGNYDSASFHAGFAVELVLKARFCTRKGWSDFPDDRGEAKRRGFPGVYTHELESLLKLSQSTSINQVSMHHIDWDALKTWNSEQRYQPLGHISRDETEGQIKHSRSLFMELIHYEIVEGLLQVECELAASKGPFNFFGFVQGLNCPGRWDVVVSAWWLVVQTKAESDSLLNGIVEKIRAVLDDDLLLSSGQTRIYPPYDDWILRFHAMGQMMGYLEHQPMSITSHNVVIDRFMPPAYIITNVPRRQP